MRIPMELVNEFPKCDTEVITRMSRHGLPNRTWGRLQGAVARIFHINPGYTCSLNLIEFVFALNADHQFRQVRSFRVGLRLNCPLTKRQMYRATLLEPTCRVRQFIFRMKGRHVRVPALGHQVVIAREGEKSEQNQHAWGLQRTFLKKMFRTNGQGASQWFFIWRSSMLEISPLDCQIGGFFFVASLSVNERRAVSRHLGWNS